MKCYLAIGMRLLTPDEGHAGVGQSALYKGLTKYITKELYIPVFYRHKLLHM